ncbi:MAG: rhomboid family intramembrane serine protease [Spirochaetes bacterium]|nr:rhomboid family intramembrane serine protease [Spirochaetota bacterium]
MNPTGMLRKPFRYSYGNAVLILIGINILVFFLTGMIKSSYLYLSMVPSLVLQGWVWQFVSYMFVHGGIQHLLFNMLGLLFFGMRLEHDWGTREFLLFYLLTGALAGVFSFFAYLASGNPNVILYGASGAVYAILLAYAASYPDSTIFIWGILPVRAPLLVLGYTAIEVGSQVFSLGGNTAHLTHLAGFGFAFLYLLVRFGINPIHRFFPRR